MADIVLDLETFGVGPDSAVVSIGAVVVGGDPFHDFYAVIDAPSGVIEAGSVAWWLDQSDAVRTGAKSGQPEAAVLSMFAAWLVDKRPNNVDAIRLWGSEDFDTVILGRAYDRAGIKRPWHYQEPRGLRTVLDLAGVDEDAIPWDGIEHIAIDCARHAATALQQAFQKLAPAPALQDERK